MRVRAIAFRTEDSLATLAFAGIMILPLAEIAVRLIWSEGIRGAAPFAQNLTVWVGLLGAADHSIPHHLRNGVGLFEWIVAAEIGVDEDKASILFA